jgi:hypothetical protein
MRMVYLAIALLKAPNSDGASSKVDMSGRLVNFTTDEINDRF